MLWTVHQNHPNCCQQQLGAGDVRQHWCHESACQCRMQPGLSPQDGHLQSDLGSNRDAYLMIHPEQQLAAQLVPLTPAVPTCSNPAQHLDSSSESPPGPESPATLNQCPSTVSSSTAGSSSSSGGGGSSACSEAASSHRGTSCSSATNTSGSVFVKVLDGPSTDEGAGVSIHDLYTPRRVLLISIVVALAALTAPLSNTM
jgi:hypothetical protein